MNQSSFSELCRELSTLLAQAAQHVQGKDEQPVEEVMQDFQDAERLEEVLQMFLRAVGQ